MGGSYCDCMSRLIVLFIDVTIFMVFLFYVSNHLVPTKLQLQECWAHSSSNEPIPIVVDEKSKRSLPANPDATNMTIMFRYLYGFHLVSDGLAIIQLLVSWAAYHSKKESMLDKVALVITILAIISNLGVFVYCHYVRFSHEGKVCSGDYLTSH